MARATIRWTFDKTTGTGTPYNGPHSILKKAGFKKLSRTLYEKTDPSRADVIQPVIDALKEILATQGEVDTLDTLWVQFD